MFKNPLVLLVMAFLSFMAVGCCPITKLSVTVELEDSLRQQLVQVGGRNIVVDLVVINLNEHQRWNEYSMTKYWEAGDALRKGKEETKQLVTMTFDPKKAEPQTLSMDDPHWKAWLADANDKAAPRLYVLAQLPGTWSTADDKPGDQDPRRQILPLGSCRWASTSVKMQVQKTGIITLTQPKRDKAGT